jgi:hypothetical protein
LIGQRRKRTYWKILNCIRPEGDFTKWEKMEFLTALTGIYPINEVVSDKLLLDKFNKLKVPPIGEFDRRS